MKRFITLLLSVCMIMSLAACGQKAAPAAPAASAVPAAPAAPATPAAPAESKKADLGVDEIVIGFVGPMTGASANMGLGISEGAQLAIDEINAAGGIAGVPVRMVIRDDESDPTKSLTFTEELIYKEEVDFLIGQGNSGCAAATAPFVNEEETLVFHACAVGAGVIDAEKFPYSFRTHADNNIQCAAMVNVAAEAGFKDAVIICDTSDLGISAEKYIRTHAEPVGINIAKVINYTANDADLTPVANAIKEAGIELVFSYALGPDAAKILTALDRINYLDQVTVIGYSGTCAAIVSTLAQDIDLSHCFGVQTADVVTEPGTLRLNDKLQKIYDAMNEKYGPYSSDGTGRTSSTASVTKNYSNVYLIKWLVESANTLDSTVLKEYFETHASEYIPVIYDEPFSIAADDHDGFNPKCMIAVSLADKAPESEGYYGDIFVGCEVKPRR